MPQIRSFPLPSIPEELDMTFQIGVAFRDFLIIASDSKALYCASYGQESPSTQEMSMSKFVYGPQRKVICAYAGGPSVRSAARAVVLRAETESWA